MTTDIWTELQHELAWHISHPCWDLLLAAIEAYTTTMAPPGSSTGFDGPDGSDAHGAGMASRADAAALHPSTDASRDATGPTPQVQAMSAHDRAESGRAAMPAPVPIVNHGARSAPATGPDAPAVDARARIPTELERVGADAPRPGRALPTRPSGHRVRAVSGMPVLAAVAATASHQPGSARADVAVEAYRPAADRRARFAQVPVLETHPAHGPESRAPEPTSAATPALALAAPAGARPVASRPVAAPTSRGPGTPERRGSEPGERRYDGADHGDDQQLSPMDGPEDGAVVLPRSAAPAPDRSRPGTDPVVEDVAAYSAVYDRNSARRHRLVVPALAMQAPDPAAMVASGPAPGAASGPAAMVVSGPAPGAASGPASGAGRGRDVPPPDRVAHGTAVADAGAGRVTTALSAPSARPHIQPAPTQRFDDHGTRPGSAERARDAFTSGMAAPHQPLQPDLARVLEASLEQRIADILRNQARREGMDL